MKFTHSFTANVSAHDKQAEVAGSKGIFAAIVRFFAGDSTEDPLVLVTNQVGTVFDSVGITNAVSLSIDGKLLFVDRNNQDNDLCVALEKLDLSNVRFEDIDRIDITLEKSIPGVDIVFDIEIKPVDNETASVAVTTTGTVTLPAGATTQEEIKATLTDGYLSKCELAFYDIAGQVTLEFCNAFAGVSVVPEIGKTVIVPTGKVRAHRASTGTRYPAHTRRACGFDDDDGIDLFDLWLFCEIFDLFENDSECCFEDINGGELSVEAAANSIQEYDINKLTSQFATEETGTDVNADTDNEADADDDGNNTTDEDVDTDDADTDTGDADTDDDDSTDVDADTSSEDTFDASVATEETTPSSFGNVSSDDDSKVSEVSSYEDSTLSDSPVSDSCDSGGDSGGCGGGCGGD